MTAALIDIYRLGAVRALDLDAALAIMPKRSRRSVFGMPSRGAAQAEPEEGGETRVRSDSADHAAPAAETLRSWMQAVAERQDREAFARLHNHFAPRLAGFLLRGGLSQAHVEDIVQETMLAVWRKAALYDGSQGGVSTWIFVIARNLRVDYLRRKANRECLPLEDWDQVDDGPSGEDALIVEEREIQVRKALAKLTPEQAQVLEQAYFAEKPQSVIARDLGLPLGTVKSRVRLALARLRKLMEETP